MCLISPTKCYNWILVYNWLDLHPPSIPNLRGLYTWLDDLHMSSNKKAILEVVCGVVLWSLWNFRSRCLLEWRYEKMKRDDSFILRLINQMQIMVWLLINQMQMDMSIMNKEVDIVVPRLDLTGSIHGGRLEKLPNYVGMLRDVLWVFGTRAFRFIYSRPIGRVMQSANERYAVATFCFHRVRERKEAEKRCIGAEREKKRKKGAHLRWNRALAFSMVAFESRKILKAGKKQAK
ncbi:hypothetical protein Tco_0611000 [Tanacetum coccineum]